MGVNIGTHCVLDLSGNDKSHSSLFAIFKTSSEDKTTNAIVLVNNSPTSVYTECILLQVLHYAHLNSCAGHVSADGK